MQTFRSLLLKKSLVDEDVEQYLRTVYKAASYKPREHPISTLGYVHRLNKAQRAHEKLSDVRLPSNMKEPPDALAVEERIDESKRKNRKQLPYLIGSESSISGRKSPLVFVRDLLNYDVVSFDIFDTLILRPFNDPKDLFVLVGKKLGRKEFMRIRVNAEKEARERVFLLKGNKEVTIEEIYEVIEEQTGLPKDVGIEAELETELQYCFANPYMLRIFNLLTEQKKPIVIVSDMYLPQPMMTKLLEHCGYSGFEKLYISCEYRCSKRTQSLYQYVKQDYPDKSIVHIGDRLDSDVNSAKRAGLEAIHYKNCHEIGQQYRTDGLSSLVRSAYYGIVNTHLHNGTETYSPYYEYGFIYGGLYILGFCNWMHRHAAEEGIDRILFLSRDGDIYQQVFNKLYNDVPNEYFLWSRIANTKYTLLNSRDDFLRRMVAYRSTSPVPISLGLLLESLGLSSLLNYAGEYGLSHDTLVVPENVEDVKKLFVSHWDYICEAYSDEKQLVSQYIKSKVGTAKRIAVVDVGWLGSGPLSLKYIIEDELKLGCEVHCWQACSSPPIASDNANELLDGTIETYIFSEMHNRNHFDVHRNTNGRQNNVFFEIFTQAKCPSYCGVSISGGFEFDTPEIENYCRIDEIQKGIIDFCELYSNTFSGDPHLMNISGYDAYCPFRFIIRDLTFIKKYLGDFIFARNVHGGKVFEQQFETVNELLKQAGV